jgi:hypothetical protein
MRPAGSKTHCMSAAHDWQASHVRVRLRRTAASWRFRKSLQDPCLEAPGATVHAGGATTAARSRGTSGACCASALRLWSSRGLSVKGAAGAGRRSPRRQQPASGRDSGTSRSPASVGLGDLRVERFAWPGANKIGIPCKNSRPNDSPSTVIPKEGDTRSYASRKDSPRRGFAWPTVAILRPLAGSERK